MKTKHKCIFCLAENNGFNTVEHIVPESLGNTEDILENTVCDKCQNYFGREIENYVLRKTPFGFWRTLSGTLSKKGKMPFFDGTQNKRTSEKLNDYHEYSDKGLTIYSGDNESIIAVEVQDAKIKEEILTGKKQNIKIVMTPKMLIYMGRFLGKIALEYWCKEFNEDVFNLRFNEIRKYIRYGTVKKMWPIFQGHLKENLLLYSKEKDIGKRTLYAYRFFEIDGQVLFCFDIGLERYSIILTERIPEGEIFTEEFMSALCADTTNVPNILYYDL